MSGALFAINAVLKETANITGELRMIQIGDYSIIIRNANGLSAIIFTKQPTKYLDQAAAIILQKITFAIDPEEIVVDVAPIEQIIKTTLYGMGSN